MFLKKIVVKMMILHATIGQNNHNRKKNRF